MSEETMTAPVSGAFYQSLKRNNAKIRDDRAQSIGEDAELIYRRIIQDMEMGVKKLNRTRENMLDLSPTNADSLMLADNFNSTDFVSKDIAIGVEVRNLEIKIDIAKDRYKTLFGEEYKS